MKAGKSGQGLFDRLDNRRIVRRRARRKTRQNTTILTDQEFFEVPGDIPWKLGAFTGQQAIELMAARTIDLKLATQRKAHAVVETAKLLDLGFGARFLPGKLITWQPKDAEALRKRRLDALVAAIAEAPLPDNFLSDDSRLNNPPKNPFADWEAPSAEKASAKATAKSTTKAKGRK